jgi:1-acyl-sn-glycerol-3-phosphate acyltransferase
MILKTVRFFVRLFFKIFIKVEITGLENLPSGGFVVASNHLGRLDPAMIFYCFERDDFILPVAEKYEHHPIIGPIGNAIGAVWLDRFNPDIHALREIMKRMKSGKVLVIAPEGTRSKTEMMQDGKPGVAFLATRAGVPIVPVAIAGSEDRIVMDNIKHFRRSHIISWVGKPFMMPPAKPGQDREQALREQTDELMCRIAVMLPEKYRGVYANHPRLKELLQHDA